MLSKLYHILTEMSRGDFMAKYSEAQKKAVAKYNAKTYDEIKIRVLKGSKAIIKQYTDKEGKSINGLVNELLEGKIPELKALKEDKTRG